MHWVMILLLFNVQTGELSTHTEQLFTSQKECEASGTHHTADVAYPDGLRASYVCLSDETWFPDQPKKSKKVLGVF
jgi:hypothetical protein